jgi:hypothetical protein
MDPEPLETGDEPGKGEPHGREGQEDFPGVPRLHFFSHD